MARTLDPTAIDVTHGVILYLEDVSVAFDGILALNRLNLAIDDRELRCIIGPNGAGKTTMMDVITGKTRPTSGTVFLGQRLDLRRLRPNEIVQAGVGRKFQKPTIFEQHLVWENLELAVASNRVWHHSLNHTLSEATRARIDETLSTIGLQNQARQRAGELSHGQKQRLEIGMLLMQKPRLLLLDEPAAGMSDRETEQLVDLLNSLRGKCSMVVVEHDMEFVAALSGDAGKVTVMAEGSILAEGKLADIKTNPRVIESYLGR
ncbi:MAG: urea ABC transporter ATP-binding protein UrtD [Verrucomicrobia bacterium]|nr:urea ABC transporter ATP-binding protein UrtD [Verrucomicrobiota bacterium]